ncbi:hypothetical protein BY458DRAFT_166305 [Sporodiniella umbellata]|nr:hypothetical protein BY458DRAFT_166305 [Sporodiniella umbellata]
MLNTSKSDQKVFKANHPKPNRKYENPPSKPNRKYENPPSKPNRKYENPPSKPEPSKNTHNKHPPVDPDQRSTNSHLETPFQKRPDKRFEDNTFDNFQKLHFQDTPVKPSSFSKQALNPTQGAHRSSSPPLPSLLGSGPLSNAHDNESTLGLYPSRSTSGSRDPKLNLKEKPHATLPPSKIEPPELLLSDVVLCKGEEIQTLVTLNTTKTCHYREEIM